MDCGCQIDSNWGEEATELFNECERRARKEHVCCECRRTIERGETYVVESGMWDGRFSEYKTCQDCISIRKVYFCGYMYECLWSDLKDSIYDDPESFVDSRITKLTLAAKDKVFQIIEKEWERDG